MAVDHRRADVAGAVVDAGVVDAGAAGAAGAVDVTVEVAVVASVVASLRVVGQCWEVVIRQQAGCRERSTASQDCVPWLRDSAEATDCVVAQKTYPAMSWAQAVGHNCTGPGLQPR